MSVYVEIRIRAPLERVWAYTQSPELHERWDLRFSKIVQVKSDTPLEPQRFSYVTRIAFGLTIVGEGESFGKRDLADGSYTSTLRFGSRDRWSLIQNGAGYWKYIPTDNGVRFLTRYDYRVRFGRVGKMIDCLVFRPILAWATAWSFDRLRLWLERGSDPAAALRHTIARSAARCTVAFVFAYQGLVPKILQQTADAQSVLRKEWLSSSQVVLTNALLAYGELFFALCLVVFWRARWPVFVVIGLMVAATAGVALNPARHLGAVFNPVALNLTIIALGIVDLLASRNVPSASQCLRSTTPPG